MDYVVIRCVAAGQAAHFGKLENFEDDFELFESVPLLETFPFDAAYRMSPDFPDKLELHEFLRTIGGQVVLSRRVRDFLGSEGVGGVEYLPVNLINHKGRSVQEEYFVLNVLRSVDCIDQEATEFEWDSLDDELMDHVSNLTIDEGRLDPSADVFRLKYLNRFVIIRRAVADKMADAGFRGFTTSEVSDITR